MAPIIGITCDSDGTPGPTDFHHQHYSCSVEAAGAVARPIYYSHPIERIAELVDGLDGMLFSGGDDLDPALYGESWHPKAQAVDPQRQAFELALLAEAERRGMPILGICLGCQLMNVHRGGSLIQFLPDVPRPGQLEHRKVNGIVRRHPIHLEEESILARAIGSTVLVGNTYHKRAVNRPGRGMRVTGRAPDGVVEAIEDPSFDLFVGVQWHPERISAEPDHAAIFRLLVSRAQQRRRSLAARD